MKLNSLKTCIQFAKEPITGILLFYISCKVNYVKMKVLSFAQSMNKTCI